MIQAGRPLVSIIVPSFNQGKFLRESIESCLEQAYRPIEILVLDGGSTDESVSVLRSIHAAELHWWSEKDDGVVDAVNKGLSRASGDILTVQSSDDVFLPGAIGAAVDALIASPRAGVVYGDVELIDEASMPIGADDQGEFDLAEYLGRFQYIPQPGTCFTRQAMEATGNWRHSVSYAADADFWMRMAVNFVVLKLPRRMARYRYHAEQRDSHKARISLDWATAVGDLIKSYKLDSRTIRYARMGIHLARYRYAAPSDWWSRTKTLYAAMLANPSGLLDPRFPKRELLPGRAPIWAFLSSVKRKLGLRPRRA